MMEFIQFAFIVILPLVVVGGALASLFAIGALFDALENPQAMRARIEGAFRPSTRAARTPGPSHYYRPHWLGGNKPEVQAMSQQPAPRQ